MCGSWWAVGWHDMGDCCINYVFLFCVLFGFVLQHFGALLILEGFSLPGLDNSRYIEQLASEHAFQSRAHTPTISFTRITYSRPLFSCPNYPGPGNRQLGTISTPLNPLKLFKLTNPKPVHPCFVLSYGNHNKDSCHNFSLLLLFPVSSHCFPLKLLLI